MQSERPRPVPGSYILVLQLQREERLAVGKLGDYCLNPGYYLYFGSALSGLESRVRRHLRADKKRHWHIDSLTAVAQACQVWWTLGTARLECRWYQGSADCQGISVPVPGFGSSDCRCQSHLVYAADWPAVEELRYRINQVSPLERYLPRPGDRGFQPSLPPTAAG